MEMEDTHHIYICAECTCAELVVEIGEACVQ